MIRLILTRGLPASGKTFWAKQYCLDNPNFVNICKDDLRLTIKGERKVIAERNKLTREAFAQGKSVIWSDTNFNPVHHKTALTIAKEFHVLVIETQDFTQHVSLEECIKRDNARANGVGETVIKRMYNQYLKPHIIVPKYNQDLPDCYIFDIDGTLALKGNRSLYDWSKVGLDTDNTNTIKIFKLLKLFEKNKHFIFSGRDAVCKPETIQWLDKYDIKHDGLFMRPEKDMRPDTIIKEEIYQKEIKGKYNVLGIFDDRNSVVEMWRSLGLTCFQVEEGDF